MQDLKQSTFQFAFAVGKFILDLPYNIVNKGYSAQLIRSSASVGGNYRAAKRAKSDANFINKLKIVEEEVDESIYFPELLCEFNQSFKERITNLVIEGTQILKIIVSSINTTRTRL